LQKAVKVNTEFKKLKKANPVKPKAAPAKKAASKK
jgi:hypothetical protein